MSHERDELALREALERRRPVSLPPGFIERLDVIPAEVRPLPPRPARMLVALAPWAAVAAVVVGIVLAPYIVRVVQDGGPAATAPDAPWDPATTGGLAPIGILGVPWIPALAWTTLVGGILVALHVRTGGTIGGPRSLAAGARRSLHWKARLSWRGHLAWLLLWIVPYAAWVVFFRTWDPVSASEPFAPGPRDVEVYLDGRWRSDSIENATSWTLGPGVVPCVDECPGPRYHYKVEPGDWYWWLDTVRNDGPVPVTLLGLLDTGYRPIGHGVALLRDPTLLSAEPSNLRPFEAVELQPGETVTVAYVATAAECADPSEPFLGWGHYYVSWPWVYEVAGWRREGAAWPHFSVTVAGCNEP